MADEREDQAQAGQGPGADAGVIEPTVVQAAAAGVVIGQVKDGEIWRFEADGRWRDWFIPCGPNGYQSFLWDVLDIHPRAPQHPWFCLVGMVEGHPESAFAIGQGCEWKAPCDGNLVVFANDQPSRYGNNFGAVTVRGARLPVALGPKDPLQTPARFQGFVGAWRALQDVMNRGRTVGVVALLVLAVCFAIGGLQQGRDLIQSVAEDGLKDIKTSQDLGPTSANVDVWKTFGGLAWRQVAFCLSLLLLAVQAWLWPRLIINTNCGPDRTTWGPGRRVLEIGPRLLGGAPFAAVGYALIANHQRNGLLIGVVVLIMAVFFLVTIFRRDDRWMRSRLRAFATRSRGGRPSWNARRFAKYWVIGTASLGFVMMAVFTIWPVGPARFLGAPTVVFLGVGLLIPWVVLLVQQGRMFQIPVVGLLLLVAALLSLSAALDNHAVGRRALAYQGPRPVAARLDLDQAYALWKQQQPAGDGQKLMILVAAEGGASRAGFWTGEVLSTLHEQTAGRLARSLFAISSVSGGSVGAVGYDAVLQDNPTLSPKDVRPELERLTGADALSPAVGGLLFPDLLYRFLPLPFLPDRAEALERSWESAWDDRPPPKRPTTLRLVDDFLSLRPQGRTWRPVLIVNGASEESGRRVLTSTIKLPPSIDGYDFHELTGRDVAISTAIHNGARFPWISPAGTLTGDGCPQGHVIDGGYFDAVGVEALRELALAIHDGPGRGDDIRFVFVVIAYGGPQASGPAKAFTWSPAPSQDTTPAPGAPAAAAVTDARPPHVEAKWSLNEILAPLRGFFSSRDGHGEHMARELIYATGPGHLGNAANIYSSVLLCEPDRFRNPMDWALSRRAQNHMRNAARADPHGVKLCPRAATEIERLAALINQYDLRSPPPQPTAR